MKSDAAQCAIYVELNDICMVLHTHCANGIGFFFSKMQRYNGSFNFYNIDIAHRNSRNDGLSILFLHFFFVEALFAICKNYTKHMYKNMPNLSAPYGKIF